MRSIQTEDLRRAVLTIRSQAMNVRVILTLEIRGIQSMEILIQSVDVDNDGLNADARFVRWQS